MESENTSLPYFDLPLDLPHAGRIALRLCRVIDNRARAESPTYERIFDTAAELNDLLFPCRLLDEGPADPAESEQIRQAAATLGRRLTDEIEHYRLRDDRIGQCVRNLFECLAMGQEGAAISLRAGEDPRSLQRPC